MNFPAEDQAAGDRQVQFRYGDPFTPAVAARSIGRRLRGRLATPVTVWTAGSGVERAGLTVSSVLVADGDPPELGGLVGPLTDLRDRMETTGVFLVHVLAGGQHGLAERFAGRHPTLGGLFSGLDVRDTPHGPALLAVATRVGCRLTSSTDAGYSRQVWGRIETAELADEPAALVLLRGRYHVLPGG